MVLSVLRLALAVGVEALAEKRPHAIARPLPPIDSLR